MLAACSFNHVVGLGLLFSHGLVLYCLGVIGFLWRVLARYVRIVDGLKMVAVFVRAASGQILAMDAQCVLLLALDFNHDVDVWLGALLGYCVLLRGPL